MDSVHTQTWSICRLNLPQCNIPEAEPSNYAGGVACRRRRFLPYPSNFLKHHVMIPLGKCKMASALRLDNVYSIEIRFWIDDLTWFPNVWQSPRHCLRLVSLRHHWTAPRGCLDRRAIHNTHSTAYRTTIHQRVNRQQQHTQLYTSTAELTFAQIHRCAMHIYAVGTDEGHSRCIGINSVYFLITFLILRCVLSSSRNRVKTIEQAAAGGCRRTRLISLALVRNVSVRICGKRFHISCATVWYHHYQI